MTEEIHILKIDKLCAECGFRNKGSYNIQPTDILCCGSCGSFLYTEDEEISKDDLSSIEECAREVIEEEET